MPHLRPLEAADITDVLALNARNVEALAPLDEPRLHELRAMADLCEVLEVSEGPRTGFAGFVLTFGPGTAYDSENYRWFADRYGDDFYYLDRIVLHEDFRRRGLGGFVYDEVERVAKPHRRLTLEVNLLPRNDPSLAFHAARGYVEVGRLGDETHLVSLQELQL